MAHTPIPRCLGTRFVANRIEAVQFDCLHIEELGSILLKKELLSKGEMAAVSMNSTRI